MSQFQNCPWLHGTSALSACFHIIFSLKRWTWSEVWWGTNAINIVLPFDHTCCDQKWESEAAKRRAGAWSNYHWCLMGAGLLQTRGRTLRAWFRLWTCAGSSQNAQWRLQIRRTIAYERDWEQRHMTSQKSSSFQELQACTLRFGAWLLPDSCDADVTTPPKSDPKIYSFFTVVRDFATSRVNLSHQFFTAMSWLESLLTC